MRAFVDTTVLCDAIGLSSEAKARAARAALARYKLTEIPAYGLKELQAGPLSSWLLAHNILVNEETIPAAQERLSKVSAFKPRQNVVTSQALLSGLIAVAEAAKDARGPDYDVKAELENYLCRRILSVWEKRRAIAEVVQPLNCYVDDDLELANKQLRFPEGSSCRKGACCGAASELKKEERSVRTILVALRPPKVLSKEKHETARRRGALKEVLARDSKDFPKKDCRALGDAYFCIMSPDGSDILTTNLSDFAPMAAALGKTISTP